MSHDFITVTCGGKEVSSSRLFGTIKLLLNTTDGADIALCINRSRAGEVIAVGDVLWSELVDDPESKHHACTGTAHIIETNRDVEGEVILRLRTDTEHDVAIHIHRGNLGFLRHTLAGEAHGSWGGRSIGFEQFTQLRNTLHSSAIERGNDVSNGENRLCRGIIGESQYFHAHNYVIAQVRESGCNSVLLGINHLSRVGCFALLCRFLLGENRLKRHDGFRGIEPGSCNFQPGWSLLGITQHRNSKQIQFTCRGERFRPLDSDQRNLVFFGVILGVWNRNSTQGVEPGTWLFNDVGGRNGSQPDCEYK